MCLKYDKSSTKEFWNTEERKGKTWCAAIKLFMIDEDTKELVSPFQEIITKPGWVKSDRQSQEAGRDYCDEWEEYADPSYLKIMRGIHVITDVRTADLYHENDGSYVEVEVKCYKKDFVAASTDDTQNEKEWLSWGGEAVFTKVFLPKSEHDRVIKEYQEALDAY